MSFPTLLSLFFNKKRISMLGCDVMKGILFAFLAGAFITLQGVANARISQDIGSWQAATVTQLTGFLMALLIVLIIKDQKWKEFKRVRRIYLTGGSFAAVVIYGNISAIHSIGVTLTIAVILISQLAITFLIDGKGWFGVLKKEMKLPQFIGIAMMIAGVVILKF
jgi:bacterial/archaeal transporter family-2 protein